MTASSHRTPSRRPFLAALLAAACVPSVAISVASAQQDDVVPIRSANLVYGRDKSSVCFASHFMADTEKQTNIRTEGEFREVRLDSDELYEHPFAVMTGEGAFTLTEPQRRNLRRYLTSGGFLVASAGCSSEPWIASFRREMRIVFPDVPLQKLATDHRVFHTVYEIDRLRTKRRGVDAQLEALIIEGRVVAVFSADGLNDTANAGGNCCCCGGNEVLDARKMNVNLLAYALTH